MTQETHRHGLYYVIPASIMDSDQLEPLAKLLYGLLSGLADEYGECFPSDIYLSKRLHVSERQIRDLIKQLESLDLIQRNTTPCSSNPFRKIRIIKVNTEFKNVIQRHARAASDRNDPAQACRLDRNIRAGIESEANIESEEYIPPSPKKGRNPAKAGPPPSELVCIGSYVKLKKEEYESLKALAGSQSELDKIIETMNDHLAATGKRYKDYAAAIRNWLRRRQTNPSPSSGSPSSLSNKQLAEKIQNKFNNPDISVGQDYIEFYISPVVPAEHIKFTEHGFRERVLNRLRKWNLKTDEL